MLPDYRAIVEDYVRDDSSIINEPDVDQAILAAAEELDKVAPNTIVEELVEVTETKRFTMPDEWSAGFSTITQVEYPADQVPPSVLGVDEYMVWGTPSGETLLLAQDIPANEPVWCSYTVPYVLSDVADSIPVKYRHAVSLYAASLLCDQLAAFYSGESDSNFSADVADHGGKAKAFRASSSRYRSMFYSFFGKKTPSASSGPPAAGVIIENTLVSGNKAGWMRRGR